MRVLIQVRPSLAMRGAVEATPDMATAAVGELEHMLPGVVFDGGFAPVQIPLPVAPEGGGDPFAFAQSVEFSFEAENSTYLLRATLPDEPMAQRQALVGASANPEVVGIFGDPVIETCPICPGDGPKGSAGDVARLLSVERLANEGLDGTGVLLAVVDTGVNIAHLRSKEQVPKLDRRRSWTPAGVATVPGRHPVDHGTMCAFDAGITAPKASLLDHAVLLSRRAGETVMSGLLSDAVAAFGQLLQILMRIPRGRRRMVVTNSWGMFSPSWDFPIGHPGNYSNNSAHPFNVIVASLENAGADVLFAAGNCGRDCPDRRCRFNARPICGAQLPPQRAQRCRHRYEKKTCRLFLAGAGETKRRQARHLRLYALRRLRGLRRRRRHVRSMSGRRRRNSSIPNTLFIFAGETVAAALPDIQECRGSRR